MEKKVIINAKGIIFIFSKMGANHYRNKFSLDDIMKFRDKLNARLSESGIPVRCGELDELDLYEFFDMASYDQKMNYVGFQNAYDPDKKIMNMQFYKTYFLDNVDSDIIDPLNIRDECVLAYLDV